MKYKQFTVGVLFVAIAVTIAVFVPKSLQKDAAYTLFVLIPVVFGAHFIHDGTKSLPCEQLKTDKKGGYIRD